VTRHPREELTALLDGALPAARAAQVAAHVEGCDTCRAERDRIASALAAFRSLPRGPEPSPQFSARLAARLAREERPRRPWGPRLAAWADRPSLRWKIAAPAAAAALAAGVVVVAIRIQRAEEAAVAEHLDLLLHYEEVASVGDVSSPEDAQVVARLDELEPKGAKP
jgi:anti-sigma factor RsiW